LASGRMLRWCTIRSLNLRLMTGREKCHLHHIPSDEVTCEAVIGSLSIKHWAAHFSRAPLCADVIKIFFYEPAHYRPFLLLALRPFKGHGSFRLTSGRIRQKRSRRSISVSAASMRFASAVTRWVKVRGVHINSNSSCGRVVLCTTACAKFDCPLLFFTDGKN